MSKTVDEIFYEGLLSKNAEETSLTPKSEVPNKISSRSAFSHPDTHPYVLDLALLKHFHLEWMNWLPETLFKEIEQTFQTSIAGINRIKIMAVQTLHVTDMYWEKWELFEKIIWSLNGHVPRLDSLQPPDLPTLFAGVDMAQSIREETYSEEVGRYCAAVFLNENVFYAAPPLDFCQKYITQPYYICKDCDKKSSALPPFDGLCSSCGGHFNDDKPLNFKPDPEAMKRGFGRNLTYGKTYDPDPIKQRFEELNAMAGDLTSHIKETVEDIQAAKLITAVDFMSHTSQQLSNQLASLRDWLEMS